MLSLEDLIGVDSSVSSFNFRLRIFGDYLVDCPAPIDYPGTDAHEVLVRCSYEIGRGRLAALERRESCLDGSSRSMVLISGRL